MSNFDILMELIGVKATRRVIKSLGGRVVRVRKKEKKIAEQYFEDPELQAQDDLIAGIMLGCSKYYINQIKKSARWRK